MSLIESVPDIGYGGSQGIFVGRYAAYPTTDSRGGLKFDLTGAVPTDAKVLQAKVGLKSYYKENSTAKKVGLHPLTRGFTHDATWNRYNATSAWTTAGGEFDATPSTTTSVGTALGWHHWYPTELAQEWVNGTRPNNGFVLKDVAGEPKNGTEFRSSEYGTSADRPYLDVMWYPRTGHLSAYPYSDYPLRDGTVLRVNAATGNLFFERNDVGGTGTGTDFFMSHYFNSRAADADYIHSGFAPAPWSSSNGKFVGGTVMSNGDFIHQGSSGYLLPFLKQANGTYKSPSELESTTLTQSSSAPWEKTFTMTSEDGSVSYFGADGTWTSQKDAANNTFTLNYPSPSYLHTSVTGTNGQNTTFNYVGSSGNERTSKATNPAGQYVTYTHTSDRLTSEGRNGTTQITYGYASNGKLNRITDAAGRVTQISIGSDNRVAWIIDGPNATDPKTTYSYGIAASPCDATAVTKTTVAHPDGKQDVFCTDRQGQLIEATSTGAESPSLQSLAVQQYATEYNLSMFDAKAAVELQDRGAALGDDVAASSSGSGYAGAWFDNTTRRHKVALTSGTNPAGAQAAISARGLTGSTDIVLVANTQSQLETARDAIITSLVDLIDAGLVEIGFRQSTNSVYLRVDSSLTTAQLARVTAARNAVSVATSVETVPTSAMGFEQYACTGKGCDAPMRGGLHIFVSDGGDCTSGFVATTPTGAGYLMTAGHCVEPTSGYMWFSGAESVGELNEIGFPAPFVNDSRGDAGLIGLANGDYATPLMPWVFVFANSYPQARPAVRTTRDSRYRISQVRTSKEGLQRCWTGQVTGTRCGDVDQVNWDGTPEGGDERVENLGVIRAYNCGPGKRFQRAVTRGDSGGPVYKGNAAYGLIVGARKGDPCLMVFQGAKNANALLPADILTP